MFIVTKVFLWPSDSVKSQYKCKQTLLSRDILIKSSFTVYIVIIDNSVFNLELMYFLFVCKVVFNWQCFSKLVSRSISCEEATVKQMVFKLYLCIWWCGFTVFKTIFLSRCKQRSYRLWTILNKGLICSLQLSHRNNVIQKLRNQNKEMTDTVWSHGMISMTLSF